MEGAGRVVPALPALLTAEVKPMTGHLGCCRRGGEVARGVIAVAGG